MTPPTLLAGNVDGTSLKLIYGEALKTDSVPAASAYSVVVAGATGVAPSSVAVSGAKVTLTLSAAAASGNTVTVGYTAPSMNPLQDLAGIAAAALTDEVVVNYTDTTNHLPLFPTAPTTRSVAENTPTETSFGTAVTATDSDPMETLYYTVPSGFSVFTIDEGTGLLATSLPLDYESGTTSYMVPVYVSDRLNAAGDTADTEIDDTILVTVMVTDVNEAPVIAPGGRAITRPENTAASTILHTFVASDEDGTTNFHWSYTGTDAGPFNITSNAGDGVLTLRHTLDYEMPTDGNMDNVYEIEVRASDGSERDSIIVTVTITDVNEPPTFNSGHSSTISVAENTAAATNIGSPYTATDVDSGDTLTYTLTGTDGSSFDIVSTSGQIQTKNALNYEVKSSYSVTVNVSDSLNDAGTADTAVDASMNVTINVTNVNEAPVIASGPTTKNVAENTTSVDSYTASDVDMSDTISWTVESGDSSLFTINNGVLEFQNAPDFENKQDVGTDNIYNVTVRATDNGSLSDTRTVAVTVTNVDEAGTASFTGTLSGGSTQTASVTDPDGSITSKTYRWQRSDSATSGFSDISLNATSSTYLPVAADVTKYLRVKVNYTDGQGSGKSATSVSRGPIGASNSEPTFDDGSTATRTLAENVARIPAVVTDVGNAIAASDSDSGDTLVYAIKSGNDGASFTIDTSDGQLKSKSGTTYDFESMKKSYTVVVTVHDGKDVAGDPSSTVDAEITVTINLTNVNEEPALTLPPSALNRPENSTAVHTYAATDVDAGTAFSWSLNGTDAGKFEISSTGVLTFSSAPDFETPTDTGTNNEYIVTVRATDNGTPMLFDEHTLTVTVTNINEAPDITSTGTTFTAPSFDENGTSVVATYTATDVDANSNLTWSVENNDFGDFTITKNAGGHGELTFKMPPNYESPIDADTNNTYSLTVKVRDNHTGQLSDTLTVVVTVNDVNETPVISGGPTPRFAEIEFDATPPDLTVADLTVSGSFTFYDDDGDDVTWSLSGDDGNHFDITKNSDGSSFISFKNPSPSTNLKPANFEVPVDMSSANDYDIVLEARDGAGGIGRFNVTVTVTNVDETPEITSDNMTQTFPEIEYDYEYADGDLQVDIFTARDEEDGTGSIIWTVGGTDGGHFTISTGLTSGEGVLYFRPNSPRNNPDYENPDDVGTDNVYNIIVEATDTTSNTRDYAVTVTVTDVNERPDISENYDAPQNYMEIEYDATEPPGDVHAFTAEDYDAGDTFTWTVTGTDAAYLDIGASDGFLTFTQDNSFMHGPLPNFEYPRDVATDGSNTYNITVVATDNHGKAEEYAVTITVTDVNEAPELTGDVTTTVDYMENDTENVATYAARDEEGVVTWSLTGADASDFSIDSGGTVTFVNTPDYETPTGSQDDGTDIDGNVYTFTVVATDVLSGSPRRDVSVDVTVTVADKEEAGTVTVDNLNPAVGGRVKFTLTDPDGDIDVIPPIQGQPPPIDWTLQLLSTMGVWQTKQTNNPLGTDFHYVVDEDDTGKKMRVVVTYIDRRGPGKSATSMESEAITADPILNAKPRFTSSGTQNVEEGDTGRDVGIPITASDRDGDSLTFSILDGAHSDKFELVVVNNTTVPTVRLRTTEALDFETTFGPLFLQVAVHDGKGLDEVNTVMTVISDDSIDATTTVTVTILDVEEDGVLTLSDDEPGVGETLTATLTDGDGGVTGAMWQWARSENGRTGWVNISGATSPSYTTKLADADFFLRARVEYEDTRGSGKSAVGITTERVFGENQRPTFPSTESGARTVERTVEENTQAGESVGDAVAAEDPDDDRLTYSLSGTDAAAFSIVTTTGQLRTLGPLDFETKPSYSVTVEVHDGLDGLGQPSMSIDDMQDVTITIENVEEQGTVTLSSDTATIQARVTVTATLADDDRATDVTWQWARSPNGRTDWADIQSAMSATFTPTLEEDEGNYIRARASYTDGEDSGKMAEKVSPRVGDAPPVNSAPVFPTTENGQREVAEGTGSGNVGAPVAATDLNAGDSAVNDPLEYSLSGTDAEFFTIDSGTGQLRLAQGVTLDYEGKRSYRVTVEVTDGANDLGDNDPAGNPVIDARKNVTVTVTNVNEAPVVTGETAPSFAENGSNAVASYSATDPERDTLTWSVDNVNDNDFWISQRGQLYFRTPPSYEAGESYSVNVRAEDDGMLRDSLSVTVTVTDVEEEGVITLSPLRGWDGTQFSATLEDDDGVTGQRIWQWQKSSNRSSWTDIVGATGRSYTATADDIDNYLRVTASYENNLNDDKEAEAVLAGRIADSADRPSPNIKPAFTETAPVTRSVGQGTAAGRSIGSPVRATDDDPGDILTYSITGSDAGLFSIDPGTGQLRTKDVLDYEPQGTNEKIVTVQVRDGFSSNYTHLPNEVDDTIQVTITVTQVAQRVITGVGGGGGGFGPTLTAPKFVDGFRTSRPLDVTAREGAAVGDPVAATHPNDDDVTYSLSGANASLFTVDEETGQIRLGLSVTLALGQTYTVNLTATDSTGTGAIIIVVIEVAEGVGDPYDLNRDGIIDKDEVLKAVADYFAELIERDEVLALVARYFAE